MEFILTLSSIIARLITVYTYIIWIRIIVSWIVPYPREGSLTYYLAAIVDPFLNLFRPKYNRFMLDFSPILAVGALSVVRAILYYFSATGRLSLGYSLAAIITALWEYAISLAFIVFFILVIIKLISLFTSGNTLSSVASVVDPILRKIQTTFFKNRLLKQTTLVIILIIALIISYVGMQYLLSFLIRLCYRIPF